MRERGWRLTYPGMTYEFGGIDYDADPFQRNIGRTRVIDYDVTEAEVAAEDTPLPRRDGVRMGQDYLGGVTHTFTLGVRARSRDEAGRLLGSLARAWRGDAVRLKPNEYAALTTMRGGTEWTTYGRPRRFKPNYDSLIVGEASAVCTFEAVNDLWTTGDRSVRIDLRAVLAGGFTFPATFPLVMAPPTTRSDTINVYGTVDTPATVEIHGPIANPVVTAQNRWKLALQTTIPVGRWITVDADARTVVGDDGTSYAGAGILTRGVRLGSLTFRPSSSQRLSLTGTDPTRSAYMVVRWRDTYAARR